MDGEFYIGFSEDVEKRLKTHNQGKVRSTKSRKPFVLVHKEEFSTQSEALKREKFLKSGCGREFLKSCIVNMPS